MTKQEQPLSRRRILGRLSVAAVGGGAMAATGVVGGGRASAANGDDLELGTGNVSSRPTVLYAGSDGIRVAAPLINGLALAGEGGALGVYGETAQFGNGVKAGVYGGVYEQAMAGTGVMGVGPTGHPGGIGVEGLGYGGIGVSGVDRFRRDRREGDRW